MIITLTLNPAVDKSLSIDRLVAEKKMRCSKMDIDAGGGGINVSKAIKELGGKSIAVFPCGGIEGKVLVQSIESIGLNFQAIPTAQETRESIIVNETATNKQFKFVMPGPDISDDELNKILAALENLPATVSFLVFSGSLPPNISTDVVAQIAKIARNKNIKFVVDTSGPSLKSAMSEGVYLIKPNLSELCFLVGKKYLELPEIDAAANQIISEGNCENMVISMGPAGALLVTKNLKVRYGVPPVKKVSTVGAGDSMVGGIVWMLEQGKSIEQSVQFGLGCGTAATVNNTSSLFKKEDAFKYYNWVSENFTKSA